MIPLVSLLFLFVIFALCYIFFIQLGRASVPLILVSMWHILKFPFYIVAPLIEEGVLEVYQISIDDLLVIFAIKIVVILAAAVGYYILVPKFNRSSVYQGSGSVGFLFYNLLVGFLCSFLYIYSIGGVADLIDSISNRGEATRGSIVFLSLAWVFFGVAIATSVGAIRVRAQLFWVATAAIVMFLLYGSRLLSIGYFVIWYISSFVINRRPPINLLSVRWILAVFVGFLVFTGAPLLRTPGAVDYYSVNPDLFFNDALSNWMEVMVRLAVPDIEFLVLRYFDSSSYWYGASFRDLAYLFCPIAFCVDKPPIDEGVYLYNISLYGSVVPGTPVSDLQVSSLPFETWSIWYANFGFVGVVIGGLLQGLGLALVYRLIFSSEFPFRIAGVYSIALVGIGVYHMTNLSFGLFVLPVFLAISSAFSFRILMGLLPRRNSSVNETCL